LLISRQVSVALDRFEHPTGLCGRLRIIILPQKPETPCPMLIDELIHTAHH